MNLPPQAQAVREDLQKSLFNFQRVGANFLYRKKEAILADDMGVGKTVQALAAVRPSEGVVVVCPASLVLNWHAEIRRWRPDLRIISVDLHDRFPKPGEILVVAYSRLPPAINEGDRERFPEWAGAEPKNPVWLVLDEAHYVKSSHSQRTTRVRVLASVCDRVAALTGTPMMSQPPELWSLLQALHYAAKPTFGSWEEFLRLFGARAKRYGGFDWGVVSPEVPERLKRVMLRRTKEEVLPELPGKMRRDVPIDVSETNAAGQDFDYVYDMTDDDFITVMKEDKGSLFKARRELSEAKRDAVIEMLDTYESSGTPVVVFSNHEWIVQELGMRKGVRFMTGATDLDERQYAVEQFQHGKAWCIVGTTPVMGVGFTLTRAADVIFIDRPWTPAEEDQAEDRVRRIGQTKPVTVTRLVADHPVDRRVSILLDKKRKLLKEVGL